MKSNKHLLKLTRQGFVPATYTEMYPSSDQAWSTPHRPMALAIAQHACVLFLTAGCALVSVKDVRGGFPLRLRTFAETTRARRIHCRTQSSPSPRTTVPTIIWWAP